MMKLVKGFLLLLFCSKTIAIDNPDAPDLLTPFLAREQKYVEAVDESAGYGVYKNSVAVINYYEFLDKELNAVYNHLIFVLPDESKTKLRQSQIKWIAYRDAEFIYIENTWTRERFGSSAVGAAGMHRAAIVRARVMQLMRQSAAFLAAPYVE